MKQSKKPYYSLEFKQDAVSLVISKGYGIAEAASNLGVSESALRRWVRSEQGASNKSNKAASGNSLSLLEHEELLRLRKENAKLKMEREILKKGRGVLCSRTGIKYKFIKEHGNAYPVQVLCKVMGVGRSSYYDWCRHDEAARRKI